MIKKIFFWTLYAAIVGLLVLGAVNRTAAKTDQGALLGRSDDILETSRGKSGNVYPDQDNVEPDSHSGEDSEDRNWADRTGIILEFNSKNLIIITENDGELELAGRAWRFILASGYEPEVGREVLLSGFDENGEYKIASFQDQISGEIILVRDNSGKPLW